MQYRFGSKVEIKEYKKNPVLLILGIVFAVVMGLCILIKIIVGDFHFSDISGFFLPLIIIGNYKLNKPAKRRFCMAEGVIDFGEEQMTITHADVDGGEKLGRFTEEAVIRYDEIESIQYGPALSCFRLVAGCKQKRVFAADGREEILDDGELPREYFLHVNDELDAEELKKLIQKHAEFIVSVVEEEE